MFMNNDWSIFLQDEFSKDYFLKLKDYIENEYASKTIYPEYDKIFRAFNLLTPTKVKVVIIGQDPYHGPNQANGLAFSVSPISKIPPSLVNIYKELVSDIGCEYPSNGDLESWAMQGVLMINSVLTVERGCPNSHKNKGWEEFTDSVIRRLSQYNEHIVFVLWGNPSQKKAILIDERKHLVLKAPHPSPLSAYRGFFGSKPFSKINNYLKEYKNEEISWCLPVQQTLL
jgi:uracil-DNA glycosylase